MKTSSLLDCCDLHEARRVGLRVHGNGLELGGAAPEVRFEGWLAPARCSQFSFWWPQMLFYLGSPPDNGGGRAYPGVSSPTPMLRWIHFNIILISF